MVRDENMTAHFMPKVIPRARSKTVVDRFEFRFVTSIGRSNGCGWQGSFFATGDAMIAPVGESLVVLLDLMHLFLR
jgi:hypothetical protein